MRRTKSKAVTSYTIAITIRGDNMLEDWTECFDADGNYICDTKNALDILSMNPYYGWVG